MGLVPAELIRHGHQILFRAQNSDRIRSMRPFCARKISNYVHKVWPHYCVKKNNFNPESGIKVKKSPANF